MLCCTRSLSRAIPFRLVVRGQQFFETFQMIAGNHRSEALVLILVLALFCLGLLAVFTIRGRARLALRNKSTTGHLNGLPFSNKTGRVWDYTR
jgi:hypothetical protein